MKKKTRLTAILMLLIAICFIIFAMGHPEASFPWSYTCTQWLYRSYVVVMIVLFFI